MEKYGKIKCICSIYQLFKIYNFLSINIHFHTYKKLNKRLGRKNEDIFQKEAKKTNTQKIEKKNNKTRTTIQGIKHLNSRYSLRTKRKWRGERH